MGPSFQFAGEVVSITGSSFLEYKGDIFDMETTVNDYFQENEVSIRPSLVQSGIDISIEMSDQMRHKLQYIFLTDLEGRLVQTHSKSNSLNLAKYPINRDHPSGMYYLTLKGDTYIETIPIYIKN